MARAKVTIRNLARERGTDPVEVYDRLHDGGIKLRGIDDTIPKGRLSEARRILGLATRPRAQLKCAILSLATRCGLPEEEVRKRLLRAGIIRKSGRKAVPASTLIKAEQVLGCRNTRFHGTLSVRS